ncbi:MAG: hypothetical protein LAP61_05780 [Acidobacteriia bacterium]|nr:hypothetical protein [Terriglobia bacterium]
MSREYEAKIYRESDHGDIEIIVTGKFEDGELETVEVYEPKGVELTAEEDERAADALYEKMRSDDGDRN